MYNLLSNWHSSGLRSSTICGKRVQSCIYVKTALNGRRFASVFIFSEKKKKKTNKDHFIYWNKKTKYCILKYHFLNSKKARFSCFPQYYIVQKKNWSKRFFCEGERCHRKCDRVPSCRNFQNISYTFITYFQKLRSENWWNY